MNLTKNVFKIYFSDKGRSTYVLLKKQEASDFEIPPVLISFLLPPWRTKRSYRPHLEEREPIWCDDWSHSPFIGRSPSWGFPEFSSAVRHMPGDLCTAAGIISFSPLSLVTDVTDATLGESGDRLGTRAGAGCTATLP